jgi:hypothetical protein
VEVGKLLQRHLLGEIDRCEVGKRDAKGVISSPRWSLWPRMAASWRRPAAALSWGRRSSFCGRRGLRLQKGTARAPARGRARAQALGRARGRARGRAPARALTRARGRARGPAPARATPRSARFAWRTSSMSACRVGAMCWGRRDVRRDAGEQRCESPTSRCRHFSSSSPLTCWRQARSNF